MCFGLVQMIRTTPFRRMILHRSQRGLTDARTFMTLVHPVPLAAKYAAACYAPDAASVTIVLTIDRLTRRQIVSVSGA